MSKKTSGEVTLTCGNAQSFSRGQIVKVGKEVFTVLAVKSTTITIQPCPWWSRLMSWLTSLSESLRWWWEIDVVWPIKKWWNKRKKGKF